jgi:hypothetical protein
MGEGGAGAHPGYLEVHWWLYTHHQADPTRDYL